MHVNNISTTTLGTNNYHTYVNISNNNSDNNSDNNNHSDNGNSNKNEFNSNSNLTTIEVKDPYNNRDIILKFTKKQKGIYIWKSLNGEIQKTLHPYFVTGFTDAEGSFMVSITKPEHRKSWAISCRFVIRLHLAELPLLLKVQEFFGGIGFIHKDFKGNKVSYNVTDLNHLVNVIIPHFNSYPMFTQKHLDYILWSKIVNLMFNKEHLNEKGLDKIISLKASLNNKLTPSLQSAFPNVIPADRGEMKILTEITEPQWLVGFITGDGSFSASSKDTKRKAFRVRFIITQHAKDLELLKVIKSYFGGIGGINKNGDCYNYEVGSYKDCYNYILTFLLENSIPSEALKYQNFKIWEEILSIVVSGDHNTETGISRINALLSTLNKYDKNSPLELKL
jgi:hypothetical protein